MTAITDLQHFDFAPFNANSKLVAIGWLDVNADYYQGDVEQLFFLTLAKLLKDPWQPFIAAGFHDCAFCRFTGGPRTLSVADGTVSLGCNNLFVPAADCIFVAPSLVIHYIDSHQYAPPTCFREAVMNCPEMGSVAYLNAIRRHVSLAEFRGGHSTI